MCCVSRYEVSHSLSNCMVVPLVKGLVLCVLGMEGRTLPVLVSHSATALHP